MTKYIFITGGVVSPLGKGIVVSSLGRLLKNRGLKVTMQKFGPYINTNPGTMNPYQRDEVFVIGDGTEADLDLGHYEKFADVRASKYSNVTTGEIYSEILEGEHQGDYQGATIQVIPHIANMVKGKIIRTGQMTDSDVAILEVGSTAGDIESTPFMETIHQMKHEVGANNVIYTHVTLVLYLRAAHEIKTKPTQHSVATLRSIGIRPNMLVLHAEKEVGQKLRNKIANFTNTPAKVIMESTDAPLLFDIPLNFQKQGMDQLVCDHFKLTSPKGEADMGEWVKLEKRSISLKYKTKTTLVGRYAELEDAYISITEALKYVGYFYNSEVEVDKAQTEDVTKDNIVDFMKNSDELIVPGGSGLCGPERVITAIEYACENDIPFLGICLGIQMVTVGSARDVLDCKDANITGADPETKDNTIDLAADQEGQNTIGGTLCLGLRPACLKKGTKTYKTYDEREVIQERHRHRYELNNKHREEFKKYSMIFSGVSPDNHLVEIVEIPDGKFFITVQYHPKLLSRPHKPEGLFKALAGATSGLEEDKF